MIMQWKRNVGLGKVTSMARVMGSESSLTGMSEWNPGPSFADGVGIALMQQLHMQCLDVWDECMDECMDE